MAVDKNESLVEKAVEFFTQGPEDRAYEDEGGDAHVPEAERTANPKADANEYAKAHGEEAPYSEAEVAAAEPGGDVTDAALGTNVGTVVVDHTDEVLEPHAHTERVVVDNQDGRIV